SENVGAGNAGPNAPLNGGTYNDTMALDTYLSKAPAYKVILGVPTYGYKYCVPNPTPQAQSTCGLESDSYAATLWEFSCAQKLAVHWDPVAQEPYATWYSPAHGDPCGGNFG